MYGCESWTIKKAEHWRIDAFELWCWKRLLRVPWTARRSNQSILNEMFIGRTDIEAEAPIFWPPDAKSWHLKRPWCWERLRAGGEGDDRGWGGWMAPPTRWTWVWVNSGNWWWTERLGVLWFMGSQRVRHDRATELSWTELIAQIVKNLPAVQETQVQSLGQEDPLEQGIATHSCILAWRIPWTEEPGGLQSMGSQRVRHDWPHTHVFCCVHLSAKATVENTCWRKFSWRWKTLPVKAFLPFSLTVFKHGFGYATGIENARN